MDIFLKLDGSVDIQYGPLITYWTNFVFENLTGDASLSSVEFCYGLNIVESQTTS